MKVYSNDLSKVGVHTLTVRAQLRDWPSAVYSETDFNVEFFIDLFETPYIRDLILYIDDFEENRGYLDSFVLNQFVIRGPSDYTLSYAVSQVDQNSPDKDQTTSDLTLP